VSAPAHVGVYVHVPYCRRRCTYCDFYFEVRRADAAFVPAVLAELDARRGEVVGGARSLCLGGGTPTALPAAALTALVNGVRARVALEPDAELSLEANPEDVDETLARALKDAGFSRVSVGVQSFDGALLKNLGRAHDAARATASVRALVSAGLDVGVDLIVGVPGEGPSRVDDDVRACAELGVVHVSTYLLTIEEGTPLQKLVTIGRRTPVDDDAQADAYERAQESLARAGYRQYEISSHAIPGHESAHNRLYWAHDPYVGLGPGAHSMALRDDGGLVRRHTTARLDAYLADPVHAAHEIDALDAAHALREGVAFGLRDLLRGVDLARLGALHGSTDVEEVRAALQRAAARGEVKESGGVFSLTALGARFADRVARDVLAADGAER
jgi:oxygen-independent coproporphyrinogen III oxidase